MNEAGKPMEEHTLVSAPGQEAAGETVDCSTSDCSKDKSPVENLDAASTHLGSEQTLTEPAVTEPAAAEPAVIEPAAIEPEVQIVSLEAEDEAASVVVEPIEVVVDAQSVEPPNWDAEADGMAQASRTELIAQNTELLGWINELELSLAECQVDFKSHLKQFEQQEQLLESRTRELITSQEHVAQLTREVDSQKKEGQRQRILTETLTAQLEAGQERIAQMERDCALSQRRCAEQAQQLLQAEGLCRDLKSRLNRQQRNTLQFKAALEKSLEMSVTPANFELPDLEVEPIDGPADFFPRSKPVKPWSQQQQDEDSWVEVDAEAIASSSDAELSNASFSNVSSSDAQSSDAKLPGMEFSQPESLAEDALAPSNPESLETVFDPVEADSLTEALKTETESLVRGRDLEEVLAEEPREAAPKTPVRPDPSPRISFVPPIVPKASIPSPAGFVAARAEVTPASAASELASTSVEASARGESVEEAVAEKTATEKPTAEKSLLSYSAKVTAYEGELNEESVTNNQANWPSPLVNPVRPAKKKIGSLAAIDLPSFPKASV